MDTDVPSIPRNDFLGNFQALKGPVFMEVFFWCWTQHQSFLTSFVLLKLLMIYNIPLRAPPFLAKDPWTPTSSKKDVGQTSGLYRWRSRWWWLWACLQKLDNACWVDNRVAVLSWDVPWPPTSTGNFQCRKLDPEKLERISVQFDEGIFFRWVGFLRPFENS